MNNPLVMQPNAAAVGLSVSPLAAITLPMNNTKMEEARYFHCSLATASFHRQDGKKLPFMNHFLKTNIAEDVAYLENEINAGNQFLRAATASEVEHAKLLEDPMGTVREAVKKELSIEELEKLLAERRKAAAAGGQVDTSATKIAGVDKQAQSGVVAAAGVTNHASATGANTASLGALLANTKK